MAKRQDLGNVAAGQEPLFIGTAITINFTMVPVTNIAGWTTQVSFKRSLTDSAYIKQYTPTVTDSANGIWQITMTRADTLLFTVPGTYWYSLERTNSGNETVLTYGEFTMTTKVRN